MSEKLIEELYEQIAQWQREIDELEDKIDKAYWRIDIEKGEHVEDVKHKLRLVFSKE